MRSRTATAFLLVLLTSMLPAQELRKGEWGRFSDAVFPGMEANNKSGQQVEVVTCIVDEFTGHAIPGATMHGLIEPTHPISGEFVMNRTVRADEFGWARVNLGKLAGKINWWYFEAPGYAPLADFASIVDFPIELRPGTDVPVEVRGPFGNPVAGVGVGLILGCGHTPDVRFELTDVKGRTTLPCVDPDKGELWIIKPGLYAEYVDVWWQLGEPPVKIWCDPGPVVEGLILDHEGEPVKGAFVGAPRCHRGPWARTDALGRFLLCGADPQSFLHVYHPAWHQGERLAAGGDAPPPGFRWVMKLPPPEEEWDEKPGAVEVRVLVVAEDGTGLEEIDVSVVRPQDGQGTSDATDGDGRAQFQLDPGRHVLIAGSTLGAWEPQRLQLDVPVAEAHELRIVLSGRRRLRVKVEGFDEHGTISLISQTAVRDVTDELQKLGHIPVPPTGKFALRLSYGGRVMVVPVPEGRRGIDAKPLAVKWYPDFEAVATVEDGQGRPVKGWGFAARDLRLRPSDLKELAALKEKQGPLSTLRVKMDRIGHWYLHVLPEQESLAAAVRSFRISDGAPLVTDLGRIVLPSSLVPRLSVHLPDGEPAAHANIHLRQMGGGMQTWTQLDENGQLDSRSMNLVDGDEVKISLGGESRLLPFNTRLQGTGPWQLHWPDGRLEMKILDSRGDPCPDFSLVMDGQIFEGVNGRVRLEGVKPGPRVVVVWAPDHQAWLAQLEIREEERRLEVRLPNRD